MSIICTNVLLQLRCCHDTGRGSVAVDQGLRNNHLSLNLWELVPAAAAPIIGRGINAPVVGCLASI